MTKRILVTGAAGFVASSVVKAILERTDYEVVAMIRTSHVGVPKRLLEKITGYEDRVKVMWYDLRSPINVFVDEQIGHIDYVLHLAANSHVDRSILNPHEFFEDNVMGTVNLLDWARRRNNKDPKMAKFLNFNTESAFGSVERFINFSTDEVFGPIPSPDKAAENYPFYPSNPYSSSKVGQCAAGECYFVTYGLPVITTFTMNIFGPDQTPEKLIPKAIEYAKKRIPMPVFAELNEAGQLVGVGQRHWLYIDNVADALLFLLEHGVIGERYNIVGTDELTNEEVVREVNRQLGYEPLIEYVDFHKTRPGHDRRYALDGSKIAKLGWVPKIGFAEGITRVIEANR